MFPFTETEPRSTLKSFRRTLFSGSEELDDSAGTVSEDEELSREEELLDSSEEDVSGVADELLDFSEDELSGMADELLAGFEDDELSGLAEELLSFFAEDELSGLADELLSFFAEDELSGLAEELLSFFTEDELFDLADELLDFFEDDEASTGVKTTVQTSTTQSFSSKIAKATEPVSGTGILVPFFIGISQSSSGSSKSSPTTR